MTRNDWWRGSVTYQIYPRSFQDANGDGLGDLKGITQRLGHAADLGVDAIWLSPVFTSPMADMGYDVADHRDIDPTFGTLQDFDEMVARAHQLGLKVIIDQVLSHSSNRHQFFQESRLSRDNPKSDWYVWADAKRDGSPPNNWQAMFGGPAWEWDVRRRQYYFHKFLKEQPDFNFHNPEVQEWVLDTLRFWLDRGVDGFRLDTVNHYFHDAELRDNPPDIREKTRPDYRTYDMQHPVYSMNRPENVAFTERMRGVLDEYDARVFIGELDDAYVPAQRFAEYTGGKRLHMAYNIALMGPEFGATWFRRQIEETFVEGFDGWPCWAFSNHDVSRHISRWAKYGADQDSLAKLCCALLMSLEGSVCIYQGEEVGLTDTELSYEELVDPLGLAFWPDTKGRDVARTPMVWEADARHAGFSNAERPWLPVRSEQRRRAVDTQVGREDSVLGFYRKMIALRRSTPELRAGRTRFVDAPEPVLMFTRGEKYLCVFNLDNRAASVGAGVGAEATLVIRSPGAKRDDRTLTLEPNGFLIAHLPSGA